MPLSLIELQKVLDVVRATRPAELDCDQCLARVGEFAEVRLAGRPIPKGIDAVEQHLSVCDECREEYALLCAALLDQQAVRRPS